MERVASLFAGRDYFESLVSKQTRRCYIGQRVRVYRNLNKADYYSILAMSGVDKGKVVGYARCVCLESVSFKVSLKSRDRVLSQKRKNVHAFCEGLLTKAFVSPIRVDGLHYITYDPYKNSYFFCPITLEKYDQTVDNVVIQNSGVYI